MTAAAPQLFLYCPLYGVAFDSADAGEIAPGVAVRVPSADEWRTVYKKDVWQTPPGVEGGDDVLPQAPCCVVAETPLPQGPHHPGAIAASGDVLRMAARDAVATLRLFRAGWFLDPEHAMHVFYAPTLPLNVLRAAGPYRQVFATGVHTSSLASYELRIAELTRSAATPGPIAAVWGLLQAYRSTGGDASVEMAIESFNRSYGYQLLPRSRAANLFTALDAMLGGMSAWRIGRVPVKPRGYAKRVEVALRTSKAPHAPADPRATSAWLASAQGGRGLRNAIAHGDPEPELAPDGGGASASAASVSGALGSAASASAAYERLQSIVRSVLHGYLQFAATWFDQRAELAARLAVDEQSPLAAAYVTTLEAEAREPGSMADVLQ